MATRKKPAKRVQAKNKPLAKKKVAKKPSTKKLEVEISPGDKLEAIKRALESIGIQIVSVEIDHLAGGLADFNIRGQEPTIGLERLHREMNHAAGFPGSMESLAKEAKEKSILMEAQDLVFGDREATYGTPDINLKSIGDLWSVYLARKRTIQGNMEITPDDVAQMMILMKSARLIHRPTHRDSLVDQAGYAALQQRIHDECPF